MASPSGCNSAGIHATTSSNGGNHNASNNLSSSIGGGGGSGSNRILANKNSARGFQIRKVPKITVEQERDLRDQLHMEIEQKTKACSHFVYDCSLPRVEGYDFCLKHILQDPLSPYKQCCYTYPRTGKRCQAPAPKRDVYTNMCFEHSRQTQLQCTRSTNGTYGSCETNETLLRDLGHRIDEDRRLAATLLTNNKYVDPFSASARVLNYASDDSDAEAANIGGVSTAAAATAAAGHAVLFPAAVGMAAGLDTNDPDVDVMLLDDVPVVGSSGVSAWAGQDMDQSDNESVDSQNEDFLKHAGIYTTEEATVITKSKMMRLQTLYSEQIQRLHHLLRQKRRACLLNVRTVDRDNNVHSSIAGGSGAAAAANYAADKFSMDAAAAAASTSDDGAIAAGATLDAARASLAVVQSRQQQRQKALNQYLKKNGVEAVLQHKASERRAQHMLQQTGSGGTAASTAGPNTSPINRCVYSEGGVKCGERGIPLTKYCRKHILEDRAQVLFKACGIEKSGVVCQEPVPITFENATCVLHFELPPQRAYTQKKYESDEGSGADDDDEMLAITNSTSNLANTVAPAAASTTTTMGPPQICRSSARQTNAAASNTMSNTMTTTALPAESPVTMLVIASETATVIDLNDTANNTDLLYTTASCVELSAEAMSPLRVSPIDLESDAEMMSASSMKAAVSVSANG